MKIMKNLILIIAILILTACGGGGSSDAPTVYLPPPPPPITEPEPEPEIKPHTIIISDGFEVGTSDGEYYYKFADGHAVNARDGFLVVNDILHGIDETGESIISQRLPVAPDAIAIGASTWSFETIDPATAYSLGALRKPYTRIWRNGDEYGMWWNNQYQVVTAVVTASGDIATKDTLGKWRSTTENGLDVKYAGHGGLLIHSQDTVNRRANIRTAEGDYRVAHNMNYFFAADQWLESDGVFYSWNGYTWDGSLSEYATALQDFIQPGANSPVIVAAGTREEHSETVLYWIDCSNGWLYRYTPSIDRLEQVFRLYSGSGDRLDGVNCAKIINPVIAGAGGDENLYYDYLGTIYKFNFADGMNTSFAAGVTVWGL
jgi:hypothetical protein